jgi:alpha-mannosidase II
LKLDDLFEDLPFDNLEGGHWRQGWDIRYNDSQWSAEHPLTVHIVCQPNSSHHQNVIIKKERKIYDCFFINSVCILIMTLAGK